MPIYEYRCEKGHVFEVTRSMSADPVSICETCSAPVERVFHPVAVHFKGSGFYSTDYGSKKRKRELDESAKDGADKQDAKAAEKKKSSDKAGATASSSDGASKKSSSSSSD